MSETKKTKCKDLTGKKFGKLSVIEFDHRDEKRRYYWKCKCDCGNIRIVQGSHLCSGHSTSCGCINIEKIKNLNYKTGMTTSKIYYAYRNMINRCYREKDAKYKSYGGRGITVCDEWLNKENGFENFLEWSNSNGYKESSKRNECTLDRINVNGNYEPSNCRWVDWETQCYNKRNTFFVVYKGILYNMKACSQITGLSRSAIQDRKRRGYTDKEIFEIPKGGKKYAKL